VRGNCYVRSFRGRTSWRSLAPERLNEMASTLSTISQTQPASNRELGADRVLIRLLFSKRKARRCKVPRRRWAGWMQYPINSPYDLSSHGMKVLGPELTKAVTKAAAGKVLGDFTLCLLPDGTMRVFWTCRVCGGWREQPGSLCRSCSLYEVFDTKNLPCSTFNLLSKVWWDATTRSESEGEGG
jgi:hypothetical protein